MWLALLNWVNSDTPDFWIHVMISEKYASSMEKVHTLKFNSDFVSNQQTLLTFDIHHVKVHDVLFLIIQMTQIVKFVTYDSFWQSRAHFLLLFSSGGKELEKNKMRNTATQTSLQFYTAWCYLHTEPKKCKFGWLKVESIISWYQPSTAEDVNRLH